MNIPITLRKGAMALLFITIFAFSSSSCSCKNNKEGRPPIKPTTTTAQPESIGNTNSAPTTPSPTRKPERHPNNFNNPKEANPTPPNSESGPTFLPKKKRVDSNKDETVNGNRSTTEGDKLNPLTKGKEIGNQGSFTDETNKNKPTQGKELKNPAKQHASNEKKRKVETVKEKIVHLIFAPRKKPDPTKEGIQLEDLSNLTKGDKTNLSQPRKGGNHKEDTKEPGSEVLTNYFVNR